MDSANQRYKNLNDEENVTFSNRINQYLRSDESNGNSYPLQYINPSETIYNRQTEQHSSIPSVHGFSSYGPTANLNPNLQRSATAPLLSITRDNRHHPYASSGLQRPHIQYYEKAYQPQQYSGQHFHSELSPHSSQEVQTATSDPIQLSHYQSIHSTPIPDSYQHSETRGDNLGPCFSPPVPNTSQCTNTYYTHPIRSNFEFHTPQHISSIQATQPVYRQSTIPLESQPHPTKSLSTPQIPVRSMNGTGSVGPPLLPDTSSTGTHLTPNTVNLERNRNAPQVFYSNNQQHTNLHAQHCINPMTTPNVLPYVNSHIPQQTLNLPYPTHTYAPNYSSVIPIISKSLTTARGIVHTPVANSVPCYPYYTNGHMPGQWVYDPLTNCTTYRYFNAYGAPVLSREQMIPRKKRLQWTPELHAKFVKAVDKAGVEQAVPKMLLEEMNVPGLTRENVASHLQKYREGIRKKKNKQVAEEENILKRAAETDQNGDRSTDSDKDNNEEENGNKFGSEFVEEKNTEQVEQTEEVGDDEYENNKNGFIEKEYLQKQQPQKTRGQTEGEE